MATKRLSYSERRGNWLTWSLVGLLVAVMVPPAVFGADRVVLGEEFTTSW